VSGILVIGRGGQVATALSERAAARDEALVALGRPDVNLVDPGTVERAMDAHRPQVVVNTAAYTAVDAAEDDEAAAYAVNATGAGAAAEACARRGIAFVHLSTDYVFDGMLDRPYREDDPVAPQSAYGRTKAAGEAMVHAAGGRSLILRTAWVYAPFGQNFVRTMLRVGAERDHLRVVADQHGNPTNALDIADAVLALAARPQDWPEGPEILHLAGTGEATWHAFAEAIFSWSPYAPTVEAITTAEYPTPARRPKNSRLDCGKLERDYGIVLPDWRESARQTVRRLTA